METFQVIAARCAGVEPSAINGDDAHGLDVTVCIATEDIDSVGRRVRDVDFSSWTDRRIIRVGELRLGTSDIANWCDVSVASRIKLED